MLSDKSISAKAFHWKNMLFSDKCWRKLLRFCFQWDQTFVKFCYDQICNGFGEFKTLVMEMLNYSVKTLNCQTEIDVLIPVCQNIYESVKYVLFQILWKRSGLHIFLVFISFKSDILTRKGELFEKSSFFSLFYFLALFM